MNNVVSNMRVPKEKYDLWRVWAAEEGISINELVVRSVDFLGRKKQLGKITQPKASRMEKFWQGMKKISEMPNKPMGWSEEDEAIYG